MEQYHILLAILFMSLFFLAIAPIIEWFMHTEMVVIGDIVVRLIVVAMYVVIWVMMMNVNEYPDLHLLKQDLQKS